ncbi:hypothetical protein N0V86_007226 [Didymella sp. IMI 355093]|nr:hypothetical protein N0V86_007226 [Didymella sp. IMI 355093]
MTTTKLQLSDLREFQGAFSWNNDILIANINAEKPDCNQHDPATWPRMTTARFQEAFGSLLLSTSDAKDIPLGFAYDNEIAQQFGKRVSATDTVVAREEDGEDYGINSRHCLFPYFYSPTSHTYSNTAGKGLAPLAWRVWINKVTDEIANLKQAAEKRDKELEASKRDVEEAKQQLIEIWTKMKAAEQESGKRRASEECAGRASRKSKVG